jgi:hypothetical protein
VNTNSVLTGLILTSLFSIVTTGAAQVNSWTNPASGNWHDPSWSLGVLPNSSQHIMVTNSGWKAVAVTRATALNHPSSLNIRNLTVSSPVDSFNTLMLNFAGRESPLRVTESFHLHTNSAFLTLDSGLQVGNTFTVDGTVTHTDFSEVSAPVLLLGNHGPPANWEPFEFSAEYNFTNGTVRVPDRLLVGLSSYSIFRQHGGSNYVNNLRVGWGRYQFWGGTLNANNLAIGSSASIFFQLSGNVTVTNPVIVGVNDGLFASDTNIQGHYSMRGGSLRSSAIRVGTPNDASSAGAEGSFNQEGGTNITTTIHVGSGGMGNTFRCRYDLHAGGLLQCSSTTVGPGYVVWFFNATGSHLIDGPLNLLGVRDPSAGFLNRPFYQIGGDGALRCRSLTVSNGLFVQTSGTNDIAGDLLLGSSDMPTEYNLFDGRLTASNTIARVGRFTNDYFYHEGGVYVVANRLDVSGASPDAVVYALIRTSMFTFPELIAPDIRVTSGIFDHRGGSVSNSGTITLAGAAWQEGTAGSTHLGALRLGSAAANSTISFTYNLATIRFLASAAQPWVSDARLLIKNWSGSTNGGGNNQIIFGNSSAGLTAQQLSQIRFRDPAGLPAGDYAARILATGEIVPVSQPSLAYTRNGSRLIIQWSPGYTLQTSTNISGPFGDVNTSSPYDIQPGSEPQRYFRLRP